MLTPMAKIERNRNMLLADVPKVQARIKEIGRVFSLIALVVEKKERISFKKLEACIAAVGLQKAEGDTVVDVLQSKGEELRSKINMIWPHLRREHRRLRKSLQTAQRNARVLRKTVRSYVYRPGTVEV